MALLGGEAGQYACLKRIEPGGRERLADRHREPLREAERDREPMTQAPLGVSETGVQERTAARRGRRARADQGGLTAAGRELVKVARHARREAQTQP